MNGSKRTLLYVSTMKYKFCRGEYLFAPMFLYFCACKKRYENHQFHKNIYGSHCIVGCHCFFN